MIFFLLHIYIHFHFLVQNILNISTFNFYCDISISTFTFYWLMFFSTFTFYHNISISTITFNYNILPWIVFTFTKISLSAICILLSWLFAVWNYCNSIFENLFRFLSWKKSNKSIILSLFALVAFLIFDKTIPPLVFLHLKHAYIQIYSIVATGNSLCGCKCLCCIMS